MNKRGGKKYSKVQKEVDSFLYDKDRKEVESFLDEKNKKKNKPLEKEKKNRKFRIGDIVFLIIYVILLFLLLLMVPIWESYGSIDVVNVFNWNNAILILLYAILAPLIYLLIRWGYQRKK
jgi:hypothetical protein